MRQVINGAQPARFSAVESGTEWRVLARWHATAPVSTMD